MKEKLDNLLQQEDVVLLREALEETPGAGLVSGRLHEKFLG